VPARAADISVHVGADTADAEKGLAGVGSKVDSFASSTGKAAQALSLGITAPLLGIGVAAGKMAADYETNMNVLGVTTGATGAEIAQLGGLAKALGADMELPGTSAADAATAMHELGKAGVSVTDILGGAKGVLQLSAAGQLSNADAATIAANAMNAFGLAGTETTRVADLLAGAANASSADVSDLAMGLKASSAVFASAGVPIEQLVGMMGQLANAGIAGSDAGTSLKTMLLSLQAPSDKARGLMRDMGVSIYDAAGNMRSMPDIIGQFNGAMGGMTQANRDAALATIFGSDAIRAANVIMGGGTEAFNKMQEAVNKQGAASELAGAQMKGLGGAFGGLKSSLETVGLDLFQRIQAPIEGLVRGAADLVGNITNIPAPVLAMGAAFIGVLAAAGPVLMVMSGLATAFAFVASPIGLVVVAVGLLAAALAGIPGLGSAVLGALGSLATTVGTVLTPAFQILQDAIATAVQVFEGQWSPGLTAAGEAINPFVLSVGLAATWLRDTLAPAVTEFISVHWPGLVAAGTAVSTWITSSLVPALTTLGDWLGTVLPPVIQWISQTGWPAMAAAAEALGLKLTQMQLFFNQLFTELEQRGVFSDLALIWTDLQGIGTTLSTMVAGELTPNFTGARTEMDLSSTASIGMATQIKALTTDIRTIVADIRAFIDWFKSAKETIGAFGDAVSFTQNPLRSMSGALRLVGSSIEALQSSAEGLFSWLNSHTFKFKIDLPKLPDWAKPGSPTPFEIGLRGIADALKDVGRITPGVFNQQAQRFSFAGSPGYSVPDGLPSRSRDGGPTVTNIPIVIQGSVLQERDFAETVRRVFVDLGFSNITTGIR
jgi:TP901 family phage tail tape measure protein